MKRNSNSFSFIFVEMSCNLKHFKIKKLTKNKPMCVHVEPVTSQAPQHVTCSQTLFSFLRISRGV